MKIAFLYFCSCGRSITNFVHPDSEAVIKWISDESSPYKDTIHVIEMVREPQPLQFYLLEPTIHSVTEVFGDRSYTSLIANITLVRRLAASIINTYVPSTLIVVMSWVTFWLETNAVPARVALSVTSLLTLCTQYKSQLPPVSYMKAMDIWLFVCIFMVFSTLVEFAISYNVSFKLCQECSNNKQGTKESFSNNSEVQTPCKLRSNSWLKDDNRVGEHFQLSEKTVKPKALSSAQKVYCQTTISGEVKNKACHLNKQRSQLVDRISKILFPTFFIVFTVIYWTYYLNKSPIFFY